MSVPVGLTIPKLLPITGSFAAPFAAYYVFLSMRVSFSRVDTNTLIETKAGSDDDDTLRSCVRAHGNFAENVPLCLGLATIVELNGGNRRVLTGGLGALLLFRILHAEFGIMRGKNAGPGRLPGTLGTLGFIAGMAGYATYLVKGYWTM